MASYLIRNLSKTSLYRQSSLSKLTKRNSSSSTDAQSPSRGLGGLNLAVGVSLGVGISLLAQDTIIKRFFPAEPVSEKPIQTIDPKLIEEIISQNRKINQLENQIDSLKLVMREKIQQEAQPAAPAPSNSRGGAYVFELSEIIQANNLASAAKNEKDLLEQRQSLIREHMLKVEGEVLKVENKYKPVINKIKELEAHLEMQRQVQQKEAPARLLWLSCQALLDRMRYAPQEPLEKDPAYDVLRQFAANDNPLAVNILDSIPAKTLKEGVPSEESLIERFSNLEKICKRVALVDAHGGGLAKYLVSYLQSLFILDNVKVSEDEIAGRKLVDPTSWSTFDILARVRCCLLQHNLEQAARYANQLRGQARVVARDWIRDARAHLVTRQALSAISTHAEAIAVDAIRQKFAE